MKKPSIASQIIMLFLLIVGISVGTALVGIATWGDLETVLLFPPTGADKHLSNLRCPILISSNETGTVYVNYKNPTTYTASPLIRATISQGSTILMDNFTSEPTIPPGTTKKITWAVVSGEAAYRGRLILVQIYINRSYPLPSYSNTCGIVVLNLGGLKGEQMVYGALFLSLAGMLGGCIWWLGTHKTMSGHLTGGIIFLVIIVILGLLASWFGLWMFGLGSFILTILLTIILFTRFGMDDRY